MIGPRESGKGIDAAVVEYLLKHISTSLEKLSGQGIFYLGLVLIVSIGIADYLIGPEISTALFYVLPISIASWFGSRRRGLFFALLAAVIWMVTDHLSGRQYSHPSILYWNGFVRLGMFLVISLLLSGFRQELRKEEEAADTDALTGALNSRAFYKRAEAEITRSRRYHRPLSLAFIDLDNFKLVNDTHGHMAGDELLRRVVSLLNGHTRSVDMVVRMGGDEFAVLFPETNGAAAAAAVSNLQEKLLASMKASNWPVTFSIGLVSFDGRIPESLRPMLKIADELMYEVKKHGKNNVLHRVIDSVPT